MRDAVPPTGTVRVVTRSIKESEGHVAWLRPLCYIRLKHLPRQRRRSFGHIPPHYNWMTRSHLAETGATGDQGSAQESSQLKCRTMHIDCIPLPETKKKGNAGWARTLQPAFLPIGI